MDKMVKKEIKSALSFAKQTVKFVFFLAHLLFQTKGNLKNPLKKVYSGKVAMLANGPSMKNVLPRLTTDEFKNTDFIVLNFFGSMDIFTQIKPKHFCMADPMFFQENHNHDRVMKLFDDLNKKVDSFVITKTGKEKDNEIDSLSSATITSKAVTNGVNGALDFYDLLKGDGQHE